METKLGKSELSKEDAHIANIDFEPNAAFFAVFDGHGGNEASVYCERHLEKVFKGLPEYKLKDYENAFIKCFIEMDKLLESPDGKREMIEINKSSNVR